MPCGGDQVVFLGSSTEESFQSKNVYRSAGNCRCHVRLSVSVLVWACHCVCMCTCARRCLFATCSHPDNDFSYVWQYVNFYMKNIEMGFKILFYYVSILNMSKREKERVRDLSIKCVFCIWTTWWYTICYRYNKKHKNIFQSWIHRIKNEGKNPN